MRHLTCQSARSRKQKDPVRPRPKRCQKPANHKHGLKALLGERPCRLKIGRSPVRSWVRPITNEASTVSSCHLHLVSGPLKGISTVFHWQVLADTCPPPHTHTHAKTPAAFAPPLPSRPFRKQIYLPNTLHATCTDSRRFAVDIHTHARGPPPPRGMERATEKDVHVVSAAPPLTLSSSSLTSSSISCCQMEGLLPAWYSRVSAPRPA